MIIGRKVKLDEGGVLLVALLTCVILGITIGSYLSLIYNQQLSVTRAQAWNAALVVAEAGIEEAMAHLNSGVTTNNFAVNSWVNIGGGIFQKTNYLGDSYSVVDIRTRPAVTNVDPVLVSVAYVPGPISRPPISRTVQVGTKGKSIAGIPSGMVVSTTIELKGGGVAIDSFNSSDSKYSTGGMYDPTKAKDTAQVTTTSTKGNDINVGNASIKGSVHTGPGSKVGTGAHGSVGDNAWVDAGTPGIQKGHFKDDASFTISEVTLPSVSSWLTPLSGKYKINGAAYNYVLNNSGAWKVSALSGSVYITGANVVLYVTDTFDSEKIVLAPGASVSMYVGAADVKISGQGIINQGGQSKNLTYYGLPSNKSFTLGGNAAFIGSIYAPQADFVLSGGGNNDFDYAGSCVVKSVKMNGHFKFHYDEALADVPAATGFTAISWDEL